MFQITIVAARPNFNGKLYPQPGTAPIRHAVSARDRVHDVCGLGVPGVLDRRLDFSLALVSTPQFSVTNLYYQPQDNRRMSCPV